MRKQLVRSVAPILVFGLTRGVIAIWISSMKTDARIDTPQDSTTQQPGTRSFVHRFEVAPQLSVVHARPSSHETGV